MCLYTDLGALDLAREGLFVLKLALAYLREAKYLRSSEVSLTNSIFELLSCSNGFIVIVSNDVFAGNASKQFPFETWSAIPLKGGNIPYCMCHI